MVTVVTVVTAVTEHKDNGNTDSNTGSTTDSNTADRMKQPEQQQQQQADKPAQSSRFKLRYLFTFKGEQWLIAWLIGLVTLLATVGLLSVSGWFISAAAIAGIISGASAISFDFLRPAAIIRTFAIARTAGRYGERLASHHAVLGLLSDLRCWFFSALAGQRIDFLRTVTGSADTMQRLTHDIDQLDELPLRLWAPWFWALSLQLLLLGIIAAVSLPLVKTVALPLLLAGVLVPAIGILLGRNIATEHARLAETRRRQLIHPLSASTSLLLWQKWDDFQRIFHAGDARFNQLHERIRCTGMGLELLQQTILAAVILLLLYAGYPLVSNGSLSVPMLLAFVLAILGMYEVLLPLAANYTAYGFAVASRERLNQLLDTRTDRQTPLAADTATDIDTGNSNSNNSDTSCDSPAPIQLTAHSVTATFPDALTGAENVSFSLHSGDVLFIRGRSGAGKSTLLHALAGELPLTAGSITLNHRPLHETPAYSQTGYLAQQLDIFDLTLAQNLRLGAPAASDDDLWQVLQQMKLHEWAQQQPDGLHTPLGEYGTGISGGQAQRIALARLLLSPRSILLLDEPFAGLDADTARHVYTALQKHQQHGILIIVSHHYLPADAKVLEIQ